MAYLARMTRSVLYFSLLVGAAAVASPAAQASTISDHAKRELGRATAAIENAKRHDALWTTAVVALQNAQKAAKSGDSESVIKYSTTAEELSKLGIAQTRYPLQR